MNALQALEAILARAEAVGAGLPASQLAAGVRDLAIAGIRAHVPLTPAQQHADELVRLLRAAGQVEGFKLKPDDALAYRELLEKIDPPKPPTLEEALDLLRRTRECTHDDSGLAVGIDKLLARVPK